MIAVAVNRRRQAHYQDADSPGLQERVTSSGASPGHQPTSRAAGAADGPSHVHGTVTPVLTVSSNGGSTVLEPPGDGRMQRTVCQL
jgi:hypothetical protein